MANPPAAARYGKQPAAGSQEATQQQSQEAGSGSPGSNPAAKPGASSGNRITGKQPPQPTAPGS